MKAVLRMLCIVSLVAVMLSVSLPLAAAHTTVTSEPFRAQTEGLECTPEVVGKWLLQRKALMNALIDVHQAFFDQQLSFNHATMLITELQVQLFGLPRPACADAALGWTNFLFASALQALAAVQSQNTEVLQIATERIQLYKEIGVPLAIVPLEVFTGIDLTDPQYLDLRPPGWLLGPPQPTPEPQSAPAVKPNEAKA